MTQRNKKGTKFLHVFFVVLVVPFGGLQSEWQSINVHDLFSFRLPAGFAKRATSNPGDERGEYYKDQTSVVYAWGRTESVAFDERRQTWMKDYQESTTRIGGRRANVRTYWQAENRTRAYRAELNVGNWEKDEVQLYMRVDGDDAAVLELADKIFKSVTFPMPPPERSRP